MRRPLAHDAEIAGRADDALAEMIMPDAIHHHARRQRILRVRQPLRQRRPPARWIRRPAGGTIFALPGSSSVRKPGLHLFLRTVVIADREDVRRRRFAPRSRNAHALGQRTGIDIVELRELRFERFVLLLRFALQQLRRLPRRRSRDTAWPWRHLPFVRSPLRRRLQDHRLDFRRVLLEILVGCFLLLGRDSAAICARISLVSPPKRPSCAGIPPAARRVEHRNVIVRRRVREERLQPVVVGLQDRIELVIVAAGAAVGQAHEDRARRIGDVVEDLLPALQQVARIALIRIVAVEARRDARLRIVRPQLVARDLLLDEAVVRLVGIERLDHVIAISPRIRPRSRRP